MPETVTVNLERLIERSDVLENVWVHPGDVVHVPHTRARYFYVLGYVRAPGAYLLPQKGSVRVMDAIAHARGLSSAAHPEKVYLLRSGPDGNETYRVDLTRVAAAKETDIVLQPGDRVIASTSWSRRITDGVLHSIGLKALVPAY